MKQHTRIIIIATIAALFILSMLSIPTSSAYSTAYPPPDEIPESESYFVPYPSPEEDSRNDNISRFIQQIIKHLIKILSNIFPEEYILNLLNW